MSDIRHQQPKRLYEIGTRLERMAALEDLNEFLDAVDQDFLLGPWKFLLDPTENTKGELRPGEAKQLCKDIRGLLWCLAVGTERARQLEWERV